MTVRLGTPTTWSAVRRTARRAAPSLLALGLAGFTGGWVYAGRTAGAFAAESPPSANWVR